MKNEDIIDKHNITQWLHIWQCIKQLNNVIRSRDKQQSKL